MSDYGELIAKQNLESIALQATATLSATMAVGECSTPIVQSSIEARQPANNGAGARVAIVPTVSRAEVKTCICGHSSITCESVATIRASAQRGERS